MAFHGESFGSSFFWNTAFFGAGELVGRGIARNADIQTSSTFGEIDGQRIVAENPNTGAVLLEDGTVLGRGGGISNQPDFWLSDPDNFLNLTMISELTLTYLQK